MDARNSLKVKDYLALGLSLMLAFAVWLVHNLSLDYSAIIQRAVQVECELDGHSNLASGTAEIAASCELSGFDLVRLRSERKRRPVHLPVSSDDMHHKSGDIFYMTPADVTKYFHTIFSDRLKLEYFVTDTVFFTFPAAEYRKVPVKLTANLDFKPQYMSIEGLKCTPDSVYVYGNKEFTSTVEYVSTEVIRLAELSSDTFGKSALKQIPGVRLSADEVSYSIDVVRYVQREVVLPVKLLNAPRGVMVKVYPSSVKMRYRMRFPSDADLSGVYVGIDYGDFNGSISGRCLGTVYNIPEPVLRYSLDKEVFDCLVEVSE